MTFFHTDNHTWLNDDKCDTHSDFMCQLKLKPHCKLCPLSRSPIYSSIMSGWEKNTPILETVLAFLRQNCRLKTHSLLFLIQTI